MNFNGRESANPPFQQLFQPRSLSQSVPVSPTSSNEDKYFWATDRDLWGKSFKPGIEENSGKIVIFLTLLDKSVRCGDKMLVFSQSLLTLDFIERVLAKTELPEDCVVNDPRQEISVNLKMDDLKSNNKSLEEMLNTSASEPVMQDNKKSNNLGEAALTENSVFYSDNKINNSKTFSDLIDEEETSRSVHYRWSRRLNSGIIERPTHWTRNIHYLRLDGSTSASERERLINLFNDPTSAAKLFLVSTKAGSLGVNLVGANRVIVFDASWNPCHDCQAVCRVYRYGQIKPCFIYRLVSDNTMERRIYDRQVTKQGVSDRVVDELNPGQQFTRAQVDVLISYEDKEMPSLSDADVQDVSKICQSDDVLQSVIEQHKEWITKCPFTHESLLIDRKDYRLTRVEKKIARQRYEQEKKMNFSFQQAHQHQIQQLRILQHEQMIANANMFPDACGSLRTPNILSKSNSALAFNETYRNVGFSTLTTEAARHAERISRIRMLQKELDEARMRSASEELALSSANGAFGADCKVTRVVATADLIFPSSNSPNATEQKIAKGEIVEVIQKGQSKYLRLPRTGELYVVKAGQPAPPEPDISKTNKSSSCISSPNNAAELPPLISPSPVTTSTSLSTTVDQPSYNVNVSQNSYQSVVSTSCAPIDHRLSFYSKDRTTSALTKSENDKPMPYGFANNFPPSITHEGQMEWPVQLNNSSKNQVLNDRDEKNSFLSAASFFAQGLIPKLSPNDVNMSMQDTCSTTLSSVAGLYTNQSIKSESVGSSNPNNCPLTSDFVSRECFVPNDVPGTFYEQNPLSNCSGNNFNHETISASANDSFPLCPRCRHPQPCLCNSINLGWPRASPLDISSQNSLVTDSAVNSMRQSAFTNIRGRGVRIPNEEETELLPSSQDQQLRPIHSNHIYNSSSYPDIKCKPSNTMFAGAPSLVSNAMKPLLPNSISTPYGPGSLSDVNNGSFNVFPHNRAFQSPYGYLNHIDGNHAPIKSTDNSSSIPYHLSDRYNTHLQSQTGCTNQYANPQQNPMQYSNDYVIPLSVPVSINPSQPQQVASYIPNQGSVMGMQNEFSSDGQSSSNYQF